MRGTPAWPERVANARWVAREARCLEWYRPGLAGDAGPRVRLLLGTDTTPELSASTRAAHAALPGSDLRLLPGHGHSAMDVDPALFVREVLDWLG
jgi:pimeloyl-ACP methyl ester carboxylesterase